MSCAGTGSARNHYWGSLEGSIVDPQNLGLQIVLEVPALATNNPPVANAGPDQVVSADATCRSAVTLNGTGSSDPDGDALTSTWTGPFGTASGPTPSVSLPLGTHTITLTVDDGQGGTASDDVVVTVQDSTPPVLSNVPGPIVVGETALAGTPVTLPMPTATDNCGLATLTSNAPALFPLGTTTVTFTATDLAGNIASATTTVTVVEIPGRMHGEGYVIRDDERHHFEFQVVERANDEGHGKLQYWVQRRRAGRHQDDRDEDGHGKYRFTSTAITGVVFSDTPGIAPGRRSQPTVDTVEFVGTGRWNGKPGYKYVARGTDGGEPGRGRDTFAITIWGPSGATVGTVTGTLSGGNIQPLRLHALRHYSHK